MIEDLLKELKIGVRGNSLGINIPHQIIKKLNLKVGDHVKIDKITKLEITKIITEKGCIEIE